MSKWDKLSMADRAKYIQLAVQNGITDLSQIRSAYNSYNDGGYIKDISDIEGNIVLRDIEGNRTFYNSAQEAMKAIGDGYSYKRIDPNFGYDGTGYTDSRGYLPAVDVVAQVPKAQLNKALVDEEKLNKPTLTLENTQSRPEINDPIRNGIFEGRYGTTKFTPTAENIQRFLDIYEADKKVGEEYGMHQWGKMLGYLGAGAAGALGLAAAAPIVGSAIVSPAGQALIGEAAAGMATNLAANELYKGITGSNQGYMADVADWIADRYEGSYLQDMLNKGGIYLPGNREDFKTLLEFTDPAYTEGALIDKSIAAVSNSMKGIGNIRIRPKGEFVRTLHTKNGDSSLEAIEDAFNTGTIRANPKGSYNSSGEREFYIGPYFHHGSPKSFKGSDRVITTNNIDDLQWASIEPHATTLKPSNVGQFTPLYNGVPNVSPAKYFDYWERGTGPISKHLWFKKSFDEAATPEAVELFNYGPKSNMMVHLDYGNNKGFSENGAYIRDGMLIPGKAIKEGQRDFTWFNRNKPYSKGIEGEPFTRGIIFPPNENDFFRVRDMNEPVGQWDPITKKGFVTKNEYVSPYILDMDKGFLFDIDPITGKLKLLNNTISSPSTVNRMGIHNIRSMRNKVKTFFNFLRGEQIANKLNAKAESFYNDIISKRDGILESTPLFNDNNKPIVMSSSLGEKDGTPILGVHKRNSGRNYVSTSILDKNERIMTGIHEAVSHGTDHLIPEEQKQFYNKMLESLGLDSFVHKGSKLWEELRATKNEILHSLYKNNRDNKSIIKAVDNLSDTDLLRLLRRTNGYGRDYNRALKDKYKAFSEIPPSEGYDFTKENPFLDNLRHALKYFPSVIGLGLGMSALDE